VDDTGQVVCARCVVADQFFVRARGLLGKASLESGEGLLLTRTSSVHTFFMRFAIDVVFLDQELLVLSVVPEARPFRLAWRRGAKYVLELAAGEAGRRGISEGRRLAWHDPLA
jgi:uncharacterized protein